MEFPPPCSPKLLSPPPPRLMMSPPISAAPAEHQESVLTPAQDSTHCLLQLLLQKCVLSCRRQFQHSVSGMAPYTSQTAPSGTPFTQGPLPQWTVPLTLPSLGRMVAFAGALQMALRARLSHCEQHCWPHRILQPRCRLGLEPGCHRICGLSSGSCCTCNQTQTALKAVHTGNMAMPCKDIIKACHHTPVQHGRCHPWRFYKGHGSYPTLSAVRELARRPCWCSGSPSSLDSTTL